MRDNNNKQDDTAKQQLERLARAHRIEPDADLDPYMADAEGMPPECEDMLPLRKHICRSFAGGLTKTHIATLMGVSIDYVTSTLKRDECKAYVRYLSTKCEDQFLTLTENISRAALLAFNAKMGILLHSTDDRLVDKVASDMLDRAGAKAPDRLEVTTNKVITAADIRAMRDEDEALEDILNG
jgi:hypothetical protein